MNVPSARHHSATSIPVDLAAISEQPDWRARVSWPISSADRRQITHLLADTAADCLFSLEDGLLRDLAVVAWPRLVGAATTLGCAAAFVDAALRCDLSFDGGAPEISVLAGKHEQAKQFTPGAYFSIPQIRLAGLRRFVRTMTWSSPLTLPRALTCPKTLVLNHNAALRDYARKAGVPAYFYPADQLLVTGSPTIAEATRRGLAALAAEFSSRLSSSLELAPAIRARFEELLRLRFERTLSDASDCLSRARSVTPLPKSIWAGVISSLPARAIALVVSHGGGAVALFDHGGGTAMVAASRRKAARDYMLSDRVVLATPVAAGAAKKEWHSKKWCHRFDVEFVGGAGEPIMRKVVVAEKAKSVLSPSRVLYLPTPMMGFREALPPLLPDPIALDWHLRMAELLNKLPIEVLARPHPEGALPGSRHPVGTVLPLATGPFDEILPTVGRFVFEYPHSTAFWQALCTDKPVIYVDLGLDELSMTGKEVVRRRCHVINAQFDNRNRPYVDEKELTQALCAVDGRADPSEIRELLVGGNGAMWVERIIR